MFGFKGIDPNLHALLMVVLSLAALAVGFFLIRTGEVSVGEGIIFVVVGAIFPYAATVQAAASGQTSTDKTVAAIMQAISMSQNASAASVGTSTTQAVFPNAGGAS